MNGGKRIRLRVAHGPWGRRGAGDKEIQQDSEGKDWKSSSVEKVGSSPITRLCWGKKKIERSRERRKEKKSQASKGGGESDLWS